MSGLRRCVVVLAMSALPTAVLPAAEDIPAETDAVLASHEEVAPLEVAFEALAALRLQTDGNLLACDSAARVMKVISPAGKLVGTWKLDFGPEAIDVAADGTVYTGGEGSLAKLDKAGRVLKSVRVSEQDKPPTAEPPRPAGRREHISGIAVTEKDLFVAYGAGWSLRSRSRLLRFDRQLEHPVRIADELRGCCQRCDIAARAEAVYVAENAAYRVLTLDREGKLLGKWGEKGRKGLDGFGACCNPMNLCFDRAGNLYTAESGLGRVKRYSPEGKLLGLVGCVDVERFEQAGTLAASCSNMALAVAPDGTRVYVMDYKQNRIRVLQKRAAQGG